MPAVARQPDHRRLRRLRDHVEHRLRGPHGVFGERQLIRLRPVHPDRGRVHQQFGRVRAQCRPPVQPVARRQRPAGALVARDHRARTEARVAQRRHHRLRHPTRARDRERVLGRHRVAAQQVRDRLIVRVVGVQRPVLVDDRVHRVDRRRRIVHDVDECDDVLLVRHRHRRAADAEPTDPRDRGGDVRRRERLVDVVQPEGVVQVVVEAGSDVARTGRERDAENRVLVQGARMIHASTLDGAVYSSASCANGSNACSPIGTPISSKPSARQWMNTSGSGMATSSVFTPMQQRCFA